MDLFSFESFLLVEKNEREIIRIQKKILDDKLVMLSLREKIGRENNPDVKKRIKDSLERMREQVNRRREHISRLRA